MKEIKNARQESSARSSPIASSEEVAKAIFGRAGLASEDKEDESARGEYRCRVCGRPTQGSRFVCQECWDRDTKEQEWESYLDFLDGDDTATENSEPPAEDECSGRSRRESPKLIVLCGPSHAGKTAFAKRLGGNFTVISPDKIRKRLSVNFGDPKHETKIWDIHESMKRKALEKDRNVILDACHISKRARWHSLRGPNAHHRKICIVFDLPFRTIRGRCLKEKRVSLMKAKQMWKAFQKSKPTPEELKREGFDEVYFVKE